APAGVTVSTGATYDLTISDVVEDSIHNSTDAAQLVEYIFTAYTTMPNGYTERCQGLDDTVWVWVEPTTRLLADMYFDTICNKTRLDIDISTPSITTGQVQFNYNFILPTGVNAIPGAQYSIVPTYTITDSLHNSMDYAQEVLLVITPYNYNTGIGVNECFGDIDTISIWVEPTPRLFIGTFMDNIHTAYKDTFCNDETAYIQVTSPTFLTQGEVYFDYTINSVSGTMAEIDGYTSNTDLPITNFSQTLHNYTDSTLHSVVYNFHAKSHGSNADVCELDEFDTLVTLASLPTLKAFMQSDSLGYFVGGWDIRCFNYNTGQISLNGYGGYTAVNNYDFGDCMFNWSNGSPSQNITNLNAGVYSVVVEDNKGCLAFDTIELVQPPRLFAIDTINEIPCGGGTGCIRLWSQGGTPGYVFRWLPSDSLRADSIVRCGLTGGTYNISLYDTNNCVYNGIYRMYNPPSIQIAVLNNTIDGENEVTCYGYNDGVIYTRITGGFPDPDYHVIWRDSLDNIVLDSTLWTLYNVSAGSYTVQAIDSRGCEAWAYDTLTQPSKIFIDPIISQYDTFNISCYGYNNGSIELDVYGGHENYYPAWSTGDTLFDIDNLYAGIYTVTIKDVMFVSEPDSNLSLNRECFAYDTFELVEPTPAGITYTITEHNGYSISCYGGNNGGIQLTSVTGGYDGYEFAWYGPPGAITDSTLQNQSNLHVGEYQVFVKYGLDCSEDFEFILNQPEALEINTIAELYNGYNISCYNGDDGQISSTVTGGVEPYSYDWEQLGDPEFISDDTVISNLVLDQYILTVTDDNSCSEDDTIVLTQPNQITYLVDSTEVSCFSYEDGSAEVYNIEGGVPEYTVDWSNSQGDYITTGFIAHNLLIGTYRFTITDQNACTVNDSVTIPGSDQLNLKIEIASDYHGSAISCKDSSDAELRVVVEGGKQPFNITWTSVDTNDVFGNNNLLDNLSAGYYHVYVIDANGCDGSDSIIVEEPEYMIITGLDVSNVRCYSINDGYVTIYTQGGTGDYHYQWLGDNDVNQNTQTAIDLYVGDYSVTVWDDNMCAIDTSVTIIQPEPIVVEIDSVKMPYCPDAEDGFIIIEDISGGVKPYSYEWLNADKNITYTNDPELRDIDEGEYILTVIDANNCEFTETVVLVAEQSFCLYIPNAFSPNNGDDINNTWRIYAGDYSRQGSGADVLHSIYPNATVEIFDRRGQLVYKSTKGYEYEWDGTHLNNGRDLPMGSYHYIINLNDERGSKPIRGVVTIVRY
ncbi:MAG: gliding motility-associated C-terminal domain-containing protein, partial [Bacteroidales bacterium]|nr:gliding motility-associated C-terminal domain-containing protein [Bacteroidales bacterium]